MLSGPSFELKKTKSMLNCKLNMNHQLYLLIELKKKFWYILVFDYRQ